jgi:uncharacterized protein YlxP (DUF503 family)
MIVGVCRIMIALDEATSLKDKRHIVKSVSGRLKSRFNVSVAEVDLNDKWKNAVIGVACVSNEGGHLDSIMANIVNFVKNDVRLAVLDYSTEKIYFN